MSPSFHRMSTWNLLSVRQKRYQPRCTSRTDPQLIPSGRTGWEELECTAVRFQLQCVSKSVSKSTTTPASHVKSSPSLAVQPPPQNSHHEAAGSIWNGKVWQSYCMLVLLESGSGLSERLSLTCGRSSGGLCGIVNISNSHPILGSIPDPLPNS